MGEDSSVLGTRAETVVAVAKPCRVRKRDGPEQDAAPQKCSRLTSLCLPSGEAEGAGRGPDVNLSKRKSEREGPPRKRIKPAGDAPCVGGGGRTIARSQKQAQGSFRAAEHSRACCE